MFCFISFPNCSSKDLKRGKRTLRKFSLWYLKIKIQSLFIGVYHSLGYINLVQIYPEQVKVASNQGRLGHYDLPELRYIARNCSFPRAMPILGEKLHKTYMLIPRCQNEYWLKVESTMGRHTAPWEKWMYLCQVPCAHNLWSWMIHRRYQTIVHPASVWLHYSKCKR